MGIKLLVLLLISSALLTTSCTAIKSVTDQEVGIPYYLPKSLVIVKVIRKTESGKSGYSITAEPLLVPDTKLLYILQPQDNFLASDRLCVARTKTGLLQSIQFATDDKTDEILVKLAELAAKIGKEAIMPVPFTTNLNGIPDGTDEVVAIGDPYKESEILIQIQEKFPEITGIKFSDLTKASDQTCSENEICFRTLVSTPIQLRSKNGEKEFNLAATNASIVDIAHIGKIKVDRPFLAEKVAKFGFNEGILTSLSVKQPSEGLALATLPLDILNAIMGVPANFFATALGGSVSDQKALLTNQKELADLQKQIRDVAKPGQTESSETEASFKLDCVSLAPEKKS